MPQQLKHQDKAAKQRAYRERKRNAENARTADNGVTFDELFSAVPVKQETESSNERYTPPWLLDAARVVLGRIDLDVASCALAQQTVQANEWYGLDHPVASRTNGLIAPWAGRVWCNPPYDDPVPWVQKLIGHYRNGDITAGLLLLNSDSSTQWALQLLQGGYPVCFFMTRLVFVYPDGTIKKGNDRPQWIWYLGKHRRRFAAGFGRYGIIR